MAVNAEQLLYRSPGGIGRYTAQLLTVLPALTPGLQVVPVTARHPHQAVQRALIAAGVGDEPRRRTAVMALPRPLLYESWVRLGWPAPGVEVDLFHAPSLAVPPKGGRPLVVSVHDAAAVRFPEAFPPRSRRWHQAALRAAARRADAVITGSAAAAAEITSYGGIPEDRITVVHYCVDPPPGSEPGSDPRHGSGHPGAGGSDPRYGPGHPRAGGGTLAPPARVGPGTGAPFVLWVGSLEPRKGVGTLIRAMALLSSSHPEVRTVLAGYEGWLHDGLVDPADVAVLGSRLEQLGPLPEADLWRLYREAAVFAFPSRHEGFGLPVVEAMSQGTPVVASDIESLREVTGGAAELVAPDRPEEWAEAIGALLDDEGRRRRLGEAGRIRSADFSPRAMAASTVQVYRRVWSG